MELRCLERCCLSVARPGAQTHANDRGNAYAGTTACALRSFPWQSLVESACPASDQRPPCAAAHSPYQDPFSRFIWSDSGHHTHDASGNMSSVTPIDRTASSTGVPCAVSTSTWRSLATISVGLCIFLPIPGPPQVKSHDPESDHWTWAGDWFRRPPSTMSDQMAPA